MNRPSSDGGSEGLSSSENPWLDQLPGVIAGSLYRERIAEYFRKDLGGQIYSVSKKPLLNVQLLRPANHENLQFPTARGVVIFIHGGGWLGGAPSQFYPYARVVSERWALNSALCEFRSKLGHPLSRMPYDAIDDVGRCVRFLHDQSESLGIDNSKMVLVGASSGGHLAAMTALRHSDLALAGLALFNPVLDLRFATGWWKRRAFVWLGAWSLRLMSRAEEIDGNSPLQLVSGKAEVAELSAVKRLPYPTIIMHGTKDDLVPIEEVQQFCARAHENGSDCQLHEFPEQGHYFFNLRVSRGNFDRCQQILFDFLVRTGVLKEQ
eukprot:TRINITY_DN94210_c0_g1_i1.p1 TRINITY_DN94210_c0_g1~~TRINITY_DN94210_c0_g1_i1.p1  ORF type:complete len:322 (+),score=45.07 TRINITY_DN94210_c0_g1_i1:184-1149(+)